MPEFATPETYYFTMKYIIALLDEEHSRLASFRFAKVLKRLPIIPKYIYETGQIVD